MEVSAAAREGAIFLTNGPTSGMKAFRVAMFHQLECLDVELVQRRDKPARLVATSCLNYLRQSISAAVPCGFTFGDGPQRVCGADCSTIRQPHGLR
ncbi:hypothetical protein FA95DRAFT_1219290 [Auriscalpium vulgare]|uniref:Uncharacterized protein n=1 Tax=Auriscalpium vulgare TaxID=40419 RepID=A0ACB8RTY5_9AGAM|nr:hypothetical protein FA95DRAFT_1219290 [Auriscalpium vulgare]